MKLQELLQLIKTTMEDNLETVEDVEYGVRRAWSDTHRAVREALDACKCLSGQEAVAHLDIPVSAALAPAAPIGPSVWRVMHYNSERVRVASGAHATEGGAERAARAMSTDAAPYLGDPTAWGKWGAYYYVQREALEP